MFVLSIDQRFHAHMIFGSNDEVGLCNCFLLVERHAKIILENYFSLQLFVYDAINNSPINLSGLRHFTLNNVFVKISVVWSLSPFLNRETG